ncbi:MAG: bacteriophage abortive infection AbiH family protein [bacterium]|nr:bacteriophage abortive infection AbiH family protein [bacterium]
MSYNRIVIIGNGFDLAMGLRSRYSDYIDYSVYRPIREMLKYSEMTCESDLLKVRVKDDFFYHFINEVERTVKLVNQSDSFSSLEGNTNKALSIKVKNDFVNQLLRNNGTNWIDIESFYYQALKRAYYQTDPFGSRGRAMGALPLSVISEGMNILENGFKEYLTSELVQFKKDFNTDLIKEFRKVLFKVINAKGNEQREFMMRRHNCESSVTEDPNKILFLNFNYTDIFSQVMDAHNGEASKYSHIQIHGTLDSEENPVIFGYGDDTTEVYQEFELTEDSIYLERVKSMQYSRNYNYQNLLSFIENAVYEVFVIGHSCGLSDKTMLSTIFDNENCT